MAYEDDNFVDSSGLVWNYSLFGEKDITDFREGNCFNAYEKFGNHSCRVLDSPGYYFAVWAPNATYVSVIGDFNGWKHELHPLYVRHDKSGIWEGFIPRITSGSRYKYHIKGYKESTQDKCDPYATFHELRPGTASVTWDDNYQWKDKSWMNERGKLNSTEQPWSVYEMHLGSWMRPDKNDHNKFNSYLQVAERLIPYLKGMGFTHVEFMPVMEHPFDDSWGYQGTGYFAPTSRYGTPSEFKELVDRLHCEGIGVILDWVPSHFPHDSHGLHLFDGAHTYEYEDMRKGFHPDWNSYIFNYKRGEVQSFLLSSAHYWHKVYHADGLRVDAVNSIIRLDFSRKEGEWEPNEFGGNENLEAIGFLRKLNKMIYSEFNGVQSIAEEASDWPGITHSLNDGGFGFGMKWMMGWMHDTFKYFKTAPNNRPEMQDKLSFSMMYFYDEIFMLPISHDEVVHGKSPMIYKMPGNEQEKFANLRLLYSYMYTHPGAKLLFMGNEFAQTQEWNNNGELSWELLQYEYHNGIQNCVSDLNHIYTGNPCMYEFQFEQKGFEWISLDKRDEGIIVYRRLGRNKSNDIVVFLNMSDRAHTCNNLVIKGKTGWKEIFNSNHKRYGGTGENVNDFISCRPVDKKRKVYEIIIGLPPLSAVLIQ